ncbi:hypothetical protein HYH03_011441 [Edaphochlamys debaryana]|uniref:Uncharacterized protein n=1 Tax=Edaphochlamys debaryana TaxID=47281 RepID=A0A836BV08_9CHLO|nr:hypothetical protein HYH03_011441 [Edaphochlamys debaryana]|eukprot:KAG2490136.1 hypothetical protein HYH03_011441 [Edaphochlamys debaryana]
MRPLSCPGRTAALAAGRGGTASTSLVARVAVPCGPIQARRVAAGWTCRAARRDTGPSIGDMNQDERLRRLEELTGQAQNMRTPFSRESLLKDMGVIDPALYVDDEVADPEDVEKELEWIDWNEDPTTHNVVHARTETADDGMTQRLIATTDLEEDEAAIQVPLHNCLTLCMADDDDGLPDSIERQNAVLGFYNMQSAFLDQWEDHHGRLPLALRSLLLDFTKGAPTSRTKMALWLLWVADGDCGSPYWREALGALPKAEDMPNLEFCGPAELAQLQWGPAGLEAAARRDALEAFYQGFSASPLCAAFGWQPTREESVWEAEAMGASMARQVIRYYAASQGCPDPAPRGEDDYSPGRSFLDELDEALDEMEQEAGSGSGSASGSKSKAAASKAAKKGAAKGGAKGPGGQGDGEVSPPPPGYQLLPLPSFERFLWAYCTAEARSVGSGERLVFFPQADPFLYTTNPASVNCTLAIVGDDGPVMDEFAVVTTLYPVKEGEELRCSAPFGLGVDGGGGSSRQMLEVFGRVPLGPWQCGGNEADGVDLEPEVGSPLDTWLKQLMGQEADTRLDSVTDPRLNHLLTLARAGDVDAQAQLPALRNILPALDVPKLYGPSLIAGVQRIMPMELHFDVDPAEAEQMKQDLLEDEQVAMEARRARAAAAAAKLIPGLEQYESYDILGAGTATAADIAYGETEAWKQDTTITKIVDVPTDPEQFTTPEGHADYRRMVAAWSSLPRVQPSDVRHRDDMAAALAGEPVGKILTTARELSGELARARAVRDKFQAVINFFPTDIDTDWQLIEKAKKMDSGSGSGSAEPAPAPAASSASSQDPEPASESGSGSAEVAVVKQYQRPAVNVPGGMDMIWDVKLPWEAGPTAITHPRQHGIVAWRLEHKLVWGHMLGMTKEYVQSLEEALAAAGGEEAVAAEEAAVLAAAEAAAAEGEEGDWGQGRRA